MLGGVLRPRDNSASGHKDQGLLCLSTHHEQICHLKTCMWGLWGRETCHVLVAGWLHAQQGAKRFLFQPYSPLVLQREGTERLLHAGWFGVCLWVPNLGCSSWRNLILCVVIMWNLALSSMLWWSKADALQDCCSQKHSMEHFFHYLWLKRHWSIISQSTVSHHIWKS